MQRVLIDTGAIYALTVQADSHHFEAQTFADQWLSAGNVFVLIDWIFIETMILLKSHHGLGPAVRVGRDVRQSRVYEWVALNPDDEHEVWTVFQKYNDKGWSYIDCGLFVMAQRLRITQVFSFDDHFKQMPGLKRLPK